MRRLILTSLWMISILAGSTLFNNCSKITFSDGSDSSLGGIQATEVLKTLKPAVAVRAISCLLCHADIRANVITDFGFGESWFMGGNKHFNNDQDWYNDLASTWQTTVEISGTVYVPDVNAPANAMAMLPPNTSAMKLKDFMLTPYVPTWNYDNNMSAQAMAANVHPKNPGDAKVESKAEILIRAPLESEVRAIDRSFFAGGVGFKRVGSSQPLELTVTSNGRGQFVMNDPNTVLDCNNSDILINGSLYLRGLVVNADKGCRFYVTGTVFIEDAITYNGNNSNSSLQITSARAIVMGINQAHLNNRLIHDRRGLQLAEVDYATLSNEILSDAADVQVTRDAEDDYGGTRATVNFERLLLNAPLVHSRYLGLMKGAVVAEAALFALGEFHFEFDDVFTRTNVLPRLTEPVLRMK